MSAQHKPAFPDVPLLSCPFCGLAGKWFRTGRDVGVECADGPDCPGQAQTNVYEPQHALEAAGCWNSRNDQAADHYADVLETREALLAALQAYVAFDEFIFKGEQRDTEFAPRYESAVAAIAKATGNGRAEQQDRGEAR